MERSQSLHITDQESSHDFMITGLGASAGGVQALQEFFSNVPSDSGVAYVVILHLAPDQDSHLAQILQQVTSIKVVQVVEKIKIQPDHIYVVSPNHHLSMIDGSILPSINLHPEDRRAPVDIFFRSLADVYGPRAVCVVLSGTGANGSMGLKRVKERGGAVIVQNPREAEFNEMPRNAIATELVDIVLPVAEIPAKILSYRDRLGTIQITVESDKRPEEQQQALREIFTQLRQHTGHDFSNYKRPTLLRRIERRINMLNLPDLPAYSAFLQQHSEETLALLKDLLISVTNFFRDAKAFKLLEQEVVPLLFNDKNKDAQIRIWVAGCATGEEAYSLAILCAEHIQNDLNPPKVQIFATDIDESAIIVAREGFYTINDAADVSPERLRRFFTKVDDGYRVRREIREMILFAPHNFLKDPPFSNLNLISCRNVLIYLNQVAQDRVMETFHFALKPGGYLFLGTSESVDGASDLYATVSRENHIYQARQASSKNYILPDSVPSFRFPVSVPTPKDEERDSRSASRISFGELHQRLLEAYAPPSVVVNEEYEIVHMSEKVGQYLVFSGGEPTQNLLQLVRPEIRLELRSALYQAVQQQSIVEARDLKIRLGEHTHYLNIQVRPVLEKGDTAKGFVLILFITKDEAQGNDTVLLSSDEPVAKQLEQELIHVKSQLRYSNEQHEFQAEELKASNEELQAMNEELRSAAEELETSKEELQSINEELRTVNQELKIKIEEISVTSNNLQNLINSAEVGTIFLDRSFRIRLFTPAIRETFNLIPSDYGRPITDITNKLHYPELVRDAESVLEKLIKVDREITAMDGRSFMLRLLPYRTAEDSINGVVITLFDITKRKQAEEDLRRSQEHLRLLIESAKDYAIFSLDNNRRVVSWSKGAEEMIGYTESEIIGQSGDITFTPEDRKQEAPQKEAALAEKNGRAENERWHIRKDGTRFWGSGSVRPLRDSEGKLLGFVKIMRDLTEERRIQETLKRTADRLQLALDVGSLGSFEYDLATGKITGTAQLWINFGGIKSESFTFDTLLNIIVPEDRPGVQHEWDRAIENRSAFTCEYRYQTGKDGIRWTRMVGSIVFNEEMAVEKIVGITQDITEEKLFTEELTRQVTERTLELRRSNDDLRQFAHVASHDLKEPVRKMKTYYNRIMDEFGKSLPEKVESYLERMNSATNRMYAMIEGVLNYSKLGNLEQTYKPVNLQEIIGEIKTDLDVLIQSKKAEITSMELPTIKGSSILLYQLFYNLILNSLKFSRNGVTPHISITSQKIQEEGRDFIEITFSDNGIGFEPQFAQKIFEAFARLNPPDEYEGTGMGLALCKKIVERHHGSIRAEGRDLEGAVFFIRLPYA